MDAYSPYLACTEPWKAEGLLIIAGQEWEFRLSTRPVLTLQGTGKPTYGWTVVKVPASTQPSGWQWNVLAPHLVFTDNLGQRLGVVSFPYGGDKSLNSLLEGKRSALIQLGKDICLGFPLIIFCGVWLKKSSYCLKVLFCQAAPSLFQQLQIYDFFLGDFFFFAYTCFQAACFSRTQSGLYLFYIQCSGPLAVLSQLRGAKRYMFTLLPWNWKLNIKSLQFYSHCHGIVRQLFQEGK